MQFKLLKGKQAAVKKILAMAFLAVATTAFGSDRITLPAAGLSTAESILNCEAELARSGRFEKLGGKEANGYQQLNRNADSFFYVFTTAGQPAYPAMLKITIHPTLDPRNPQDKDFEFFGSYAGTEADFQTWSRQFLSEFGRGFGTALLPYKLQQSAPPAK